MTQNQITVVKSRWPHVLILDPVIVGAIFYNRLFEMVLQVIIKLRTLETLK